MTKDEFYNHKDLGEKRTKSRELDFGVWWRGAMNFPTYRITWVENTGEVISVSVQDEYEILGVIPSEEQAEARLKGWADECGKLNSIDWIKNNID